MLISLAAGVLILVSGDRLGRDYPYLLLGLAALFVVAYLAWPAVYRIRRRATRHIEMPATQYLLENPRARSVAAVGFTLLAVALVIGVYVNLWVAVFAVVAASLWAVPFAILAYRRAELPEARRTTEVTNKTETQALVHVGASGSSVSKDNLRTVEDRRVFWACAPVACPFFAFLAVVPTHFTRDGVLFVAGVLVVTFLLTLGVGAFLRIGRLQLIQGALCSGGVAMLVMLPVIWAVESATFRQTRVMLITEAWFAPSYATRSRSLVGRRPSGARQEQEAALVRKSRDRGGGPPLLRGGAPVGSRVREGRDRRALLDDTCGYVFIRNPSAQRDGIPGATGER